MALKYFTNSFKGNITDTIAINPNHVVSVYESESTTQDEDGNSVVKQVTAIFGVTGTVWQVEEDLLTVVARLNERD